MPHCPKCNAEVDADQRMCAWCGYELQTADAFPAVAPKPAPKSNVFPPQASHPSATGGETPLLQARELARSGQLDQALEAFKQILNESPHDLEALFGLGGVYFKQNQFTKAFDVWNKIKNLKSGYPNIDDWIGRAENAMGLHRPGLASPDKPESVPAKTPQKSETKPVPATPKHPTALPTPVHSGPAHSGKAPAHSDSTVHSDIDWQKQSVKVDPNITEKAIKKTEKEQVYDQLLDRSGESSPQSVLLAWLWVAFTITTLGILLAWI